ncbi:hypothetical protein C2G38_2053635 [Gigaspora rosea]|uniref:Uncharacterized protein n=1 Tax=Gigaspora rosea TaxID=44941 RepID=A0A397W6Y5_9GLOM|nr:hypothetical protein C2G38_2053635 [Gigaspora rosea]
MNISIHYLIFGVFGLLIFLVSNTSAKCVVGVAPKSLDREGKCNCADLASCDETLAGDRKGIVCGSELNCRFVNHIYYFNDEGNFCHLGPCINFCKPADPDSDNPESFCD